MGIIGAQRSGKTLVMVGLMYEHYLQGFTIISNMDSLKFPHIKLTKEMMESKKELEKIKKELGKNKKICIGLDEAHLWVDSRRSKKNTGKSFLITQAGKLMEEEGHFFYTTQFFNQVDIRLRYNTFMLLKVKKHIIDEKMILEIIVHEQDEDLMIEKKVVEFEAEKLYSKNLYDRFEMIDTEE